MLLSWRFPRKTAIWTIFLSVSPSLRWPGDSQRKSGQFARIDSQRHPLFMVFERCPRSASNLRFAIPSARKFVAIRKENEPICANQAIRPNLRIVLRELDQQSSSILEFNMVDFWSVLAYKRSILVMVWVASAEGGLPACRGKRMRVAKDNRPLPLTTAIQGKATVQKKSLYKQRLAAMLSTRGMMKGYCAELKLCTHASITPLPTRKESKEQSPTASLARELLFSSCPYALRQ